MLFCTEIVIIIAKRVLYITFSPENSKPVAEKHNFYLVCKLLIIILNLNGQEIKFLKV